MYAGSLALLADAVHMLSDNVALGLALVAAWLAAKPATHERSSATSARRSSPLSRTASPRRARDLDLRRGGDAAPRPRRRARRVDARDRHRRMAVNVAAGVVLSRARSHSLNVEAAFRHVFADLLGSLGVAIAAVVILATGWVEADPLVSILIGLLVLASTWTILRDSTEILLESTPRGIDAGALGRRLASAPGVVEVHDLHVWTITSGFPALSAHVLVRPRRGLPRAPSRARAAAPRRVRDRAHDPPGRPRERRRAGGDRALRRAVTDSHAYARLRPLDDHATLGSSIVDHPLACRSSRRSDSLGILESHRARAARDLRRNGLGSPPRRSGPRTSAARRRAIRSGSRLSCARFAPRRSRASSSWLHLHLGLSCARTRRSSASVEPQQLSHLGALAAAGAIGFHRKRGRRSAATSCRAASWPVLH